MSSRLVLPLRAVLLFVAVLCVSTAASAQDGGKVESFQDVSNCLQKAAEVCRR